MCSPIDSGTLLVRQRYLLPQERWLSAWQLRRWRASRKLGPRVRSLETHYGPEHLRLFAAYRADYMSMLAICLVGLIAGGFVSAFNTSIGLATFLGIGGIGLTIGVFSMVRLWQSSSAREEYKRAKQSTPIDY